MATTEWESITLGQNKTIQKIATAAAKASELLDANVKLASGTLKAAGIFLQGLLGPYILLLRVTADTIDDFVKDFKNIGFFILEVCPDGKYLLPKDADGNPISIVLGGVAVAASAATAAAAGQTIEFKEWAKEFLGEEDIYLTGAQKANYPVPVGKSQPQASRTDNANDNKLATLDGLTGLYKMTPSQVIGTIIAAMDDKLDLRRPQLSSNAEAGALVMIVGVSDLTKDLAQLQSIFEAFLVFFGGAVKKDKAGNEVREGGVATGIAKLATLISAALGQVNDPSTNDTTLIVKSVCGIRGTEDDKERLTHFGIDYNFGEGGTTPNLFELNNFVAGPRVKFGKRCIGYVTEIKSTEADEDEVTVDGETTKVESKIYSKQELVIRGVTEMDAIGWRNLSTGAKLQKVSYDMSMHTYIDQNSGKSITQGPFNDWEYIPNLPDQEEATIEKINTKDGVKNLRHPIAKAAFTKVVHNPKSPENVWLLKKKGELEDIREFHKYADLWTETSTSFVTQNTVIGDILSPKTDDAGKALQDIIDYLDSKIQELEEINKALQKILALFTIGLPAAGIYTLNIPVAVGGNDYIKEELQGAANAPPDDLDFTFGFMMMGEGKTFKVLQDLLIPS